MIYKNIYVVTNTYIMPRIFSPRPSQRNEKTGAHGIKNNSRNKEEPPYVVRWWRKTKRNELTDLFYISFRVENNPDNVCELVWGEFDDLVVKICSWEYWYVVQLHTEIPWGEVIDRVDKAFKGKAP
jgi:hypothetical protein